ncbi:MAG TPA: bifunctional 2-methylcitrate synthase/citrate synthase [Acidimicrobiales bacterium]|nr:bifunctional 2-methylcitrate synthase/citrate synthase [Acidimicrobiales bacterium]
MTNETSPEDGTVRRGLEGVIADTTAISMVDEATNSLLYHGYPVQELAKYCSFEEVAYLIWFGELPGQEELLAFEKHEREQRELPDELTSMLLELPSTCHPMDVLRTAVSCLGAFDPEEDNNDVRANLDKSLNLMAKLPTVVAAEQRRRHGKDPIAPRSDLGFAANFLNMCFDETPTDATVRALDISLILYAEHSFNASTFAARVIISTLSDIYSSIVGAIGALKGPLHGGANEAVMRMLDEIGSADRVDAWLDEMFATHRLVMGFGHRVYKHGDSRVPTMHDALLEISKNYESDGLIALYERLQQAMLERRGIHPNLDFPSGPAYHLMGFDTAIFTPIFVISRITGWTAHVIEQLSANALIRPLSSYVGHGPRKVIPILDRA